MFKAFSNMQEDAKRVPDDHAGSYSSLKWPLHCNLNKYFHLLNAS